VAGASADGEVNHWPAFVDVLTTVIMVVTFLLVIMSAEVMVLSERAVKNARAAVLAELSGKAKGAGAKGAADTASQGADRLNSPAEAEAGTSIAARGSILRSEELVNSAERLTIRTRDTKDTLAVKVKAVEQPKEQARGAEVSVAATLVRVAFEANALTYDTESGNRIVAFLKTHPGPEVKYEIWSFAPQTGSVSEAQRVAFYRAALTRNLLVRAGIAPGQITTQTRITDARSADGHMVRVVVKP
jgi:hypothetical protein